MPETALPRILLVDDRRDNLLSLSVLLDGIDAEVVFASSASAALRLLMRDEFALILTDIMMPDIDGCEFAWMVRGASRTKATPIFFVTAKDMSAGDILECHESGGLDFLPKPRDRELVRSRVLWALKVRGDRARRVQAEQTGRVSPTV